MEGKPGRMTKTFISFDDDEKNGVESVIKLHES